MRGCCFEAAAESKRREDGGENVTFARMLMGERITVTALRLPHLH